MTTQERHCILVRAQPEVHFSRATSRHFSYRPGMWQMRSCQLPMLAVVLLTSCGALADQPRDVPSGLVREHGQINHRVPKSRTVRVVGQRLDGCSESPG